MNGLTAPCSHGGAHEAPRTPLRRVFPFCLPVSPRELPSHREHNISRELQHKGSPGSILAPSRVWGLRTPSPCHVSLQHGRARAQVLRCHPRSVLMSTACRNLAIIQDDALLSIKIHCCLAIITLYLSFFYMVQGTTPPLPPVRSATEDELRRTDVAPVRTMWCATTAREHRRQLHLHQVRDHSVQGQFLENEPRYCAV